MSFVALIVLALQAIGADIKALQARKKVVSVPVGDATPGGLSNGDIVVRY